MFAMPFSCKKLDKYCFVYVQKFVKVYYIQ